MGSDSGETSLLLPSKGGRGGTDHGALASQGSQPSGVSVIPFLVSVLGPVFSEPQDRGVG